MLHIVLCIRQMDRQSNPTTFTIVKHVHLRPLQVNFLFLVNFGLKPTLPPPKKKKTRVRKKLTYVFCPKM